MFLSSFFKSLVYISSDATDIQLFQNKSEQFVNSGGKRGAPINGAPRRQNIDDV